MTDKYQKPLFYVLERYVIYHKEKYVENYPIICWDCYQFTDTEDYHAYPKFTMKPKNPSCKWCKKNIRR